MEYTAEIWKVDRRKKDGKRLIEKIEYNMSSKESVQNTVEGGFPASEGYLVDIFETYVTRVNLQSGLEYQERYDTPRYCSPSSEAYWSM